MLQKLDNMNDVFLIISAYVWIQNNPSSDFRSVFFFFFFLLVSKSTWVSIQNPFRPWSKQLQQPVKSRVHTIILVWPRPTPQTEPLSCWRSLHSSNFQDWFTFTCPAAAATTCRLCLFCSSLRCNGNSWAGSSPGRSSAREKRSYYEIILSRCTPTPRLHHSSQHVIQSLLTDCSHLETGFGDSFLFFLPQLLPPGRQRIHHAPQSLWDWRKLGKTMSYWWWMSPKPWCNSAQRVCVCVCLTEVLWHVLQVRFDDGRMEVFVVSEQLQISRVVLEIRLSDRRKHPITTRQHTHTHTHTHTHPSGGETVTHLEFFWIEQLLFDLLQSGLPHRLLGHWAHGVLHTNRIQFHQR